LPDRKGDRRCGFAGLVFVEIGRRAKILSFPAVIRSLTSRADFFSNHFTASAKIIATISRA
jgi:hypothetical protein